MSFIPTDGFPDTPRQTTQHLSGMTWIMREFAKTLYASSIKSHLYKNVFPQ